MSFIVIKTNDGYFIEPDGNWSGHSNPDAEFITEFKYFHEAEKFIDKLLSEYDFYMKGHK